MGLIQQDNLKMNKRAFLKIEILKLTDSTYPRWVTCKFIDALGKEWVFNKVKEPYVTKVNLNDNCQFPMEGSVECKIENSFTDKNNRKLLKVNTEEYIESNNGEYIFEINPEQVIYED